MKGPTLESVRARWSFFVLAGAALVALVALLYLNSYKNFYYDEWDFISAYRPGQTDTSILFPHGEHWSTIPILIWKGLFVLFGIRTHLPYQAIVVVAHVITTLLLFQYVRRRAGDLPAFGAALIFLFLGTGANNIVQAFQGNQTLSMAFGLAALLAIDSAWLPTSMWRFAAIAGFLLCSLMSSGLGLGFVVAIGVQLIFDSRDRHLLFSLAPPVAIYVGWFLVFGKAGSACSGCPSALDDLRALGPSYLLQVADFVRLGITASIIGLAGLTIDVAPLVVPALVAAFAGLLAWHYYVQGRIQSWEIGLLAGLVAQFTLIGLARVHFGVRGAADPRYVYTGAVYLLPLVANALKHLSWHLVMRPVWIGLLALIVVNNMALLAEQSLAWYGLMQTENAELRVVEILRGAPDMALNQPLDATVMPQLTAARYYSAIDELGSPVPSSVPYSLQALPPSAVDQQIVALFGTALKVAPDSQPAVSGPCFALDSTEGATIYAQVPDGQSVVIRSGTQGSASLSLGVFGAPRSDPLLEVPLPAGVPIRVQLPDTRAEVTWRLRIATSPVDTLDICGLTNTQAHSEAAVFDAQAAGGVYDPSWITSPDSAANSGLAAELPAGTRTTSWRDNIFGTPTTVPAGRYDVWYRVRVADPASHDQEMVLGALDETTWGLLGATIASPNHLADSYQWVEAAHDVTQQPGHRIAFVAEFHSHTSPLSTDWFVDEAMLLPAGSPPPTDLTLNAVSLNAGS